MWAGALEATGDYRLLRRFTPGARRYTESFTMDEEDARNGLFVDSETTGKDPLTCKLTQLACVPFTYNARTGVIYDVEAGESWLNDPGIPIPPQITELTGITDDMVRGKSIDVQRVDFLLNGSAVVIAHHADFDRRVTEDTVKSFALRPWACSYKDVDWRERFGARCSVLEHLMRDVLGMFYDAHQALDDCHAALHLLQSAVGADGRTALLHLLENARKPIYRVWAIDSPFPIKGQLKDRDFKWSNGNEGTRKGWYFDGDHATAKAAYGWLKDLPYVFDRKWQIISRLDRFSAREDRTKTTTPT